MKASYLLHATLFALPLLLSAQSTHDIKALDEAMAKLWTDLIAYNPAQPKEKVQAIQEDLKRLNAMKEKFPAPPLFSSRFNIALDRTKKWDFNHPLIFILSNDLYEIAKPYIQKDTGLFDPNFPDKNGKSHWPNIASNLKPAAVMTLIKDFDMPTQVEDRLSIKPGAKSSLLHYAVQNQNIELATGLIKEFPMIIDEVDGSKSTPLHLAANRTNVALIEALLRANPKNANTVDEHETTPLHNAALYGNIESVKLLLAYKANPALRNTYGYSALDYAVGTPKLSLIITALKERYDQGLLSKEEYVGIFKKILEPASPKSDLMASFPADSRAETTATLELAMKYPDLPRSPEKPKKKH